MTDQDSTNVGHTSQTIFNLLFIKILITEYLGEGSYAGEFHSVRWLQMKNIAHFLKRICAYVLKIDIKSIQSNSLFIFDDCRVKIGMYGKVVQEIDLEARSLMERSMYLFLSILTDKRSSKLTDDMFSNHTIPKDIEEEIGKLAQEFLRKNRRNCNIVNPIRYTGELPGSDFSISGRFVRPDATVTLEPVKITVVGEIDTVCKSQRFFTLKRKKGKNIRVHFDFFTKFLDICKVYIRNDRHIFHLLEEQDALGDNSYFTLENIGEQVDGTLFLNLPDIGEVDLSESSRQAG